MAIVDFALEHARQGRLVFPGMPNSKVPAIKDPYGQATTDERTILQWWLENPNYNICLPGGYEISPGKYLGFIDVDCKVDGKNGFDTMATLDILGFDFPETLAQQTPTGGLHLFYYFDFPIQNSAGLLGRGIDTRGFHGYVVGAGSGIDGKGYIFKNRLQIASAPLWIVEKITNQQREKRGDHDPSGGARHLHVLHGIDQETAEGRAKSYLQRLSPAQAGERNSRGFETACRLKDFGLLQSHALECMLAHWKSEPPLDGAEIKHFISSAYRYSQNEAGIDSPEMAFDALPPEAPGKKTRHPIDQINDEYALVTAGGGVRILWETKTFDGKDRVEHLSLQSFHDKLANVLMLSGEKSVPVSKSWIRSTKRREYQGIIFAPNRIAPKFFNVWRGFSVQLPNPAIPPAPEAQKALDLFLEHIRENVCGGNLEWAQWVIGFFAHLIQKPEQKPRVALALRGKKGVGKNVITECIGRLLGDHYLLAANRRYLSGNFNSHLENKLLLVLDEAYWSGDKATEGILKDLITGTTQQIERKGHDSYTVANLVRVVIFGNEEWIVPATDDERRFAVFNVGDGRKRDDEFFGQILDGMRDYGGDRLLFKYLMEFDISKVNVNVAPDTDALMGQKEHTLGPLEAWWLASLKAGHLIGSSEHEWVEELGREQLRSAFYEECKRQNIGGRLPNDTHFGRSFKAMAPSSCESIRKKEGGVRYRVQSIAPLAQAKAEWEKFIGGKVDWEPYNTNL